MEDILNWVCNLSNTGSILGVQGRAFAHYSDAHSAANALTCLLDLLREGEINVQCSSQHEEVALSLLTETHKHARTHARTYTCTCAGGGRNGKL